MSTFLAQTLTYGISGGTSDFSRPGYDVSSTGTYGTLFVNSATGAYTFVPNDTAINALTATTTESFTFTVSDGSLSTRSRTYRHPQRYSRGDGIHFGRYAEPRDRRHRCQH